MTPLDIRLPIIARQAKVRPPHVYHTWCAIQSLKGNFHIGAFAEFTGLEHHHITAIIAALKANNAMPAPAKQETTRGTRIGADFIMPDEWLNWAVNNRGWSMKDAKEVAAEFIDYWAGVSGSKGVKADWQATWRNSVRRSHRAGNAKIESTTDTRAILERKLKAEELMGHDHEAGIIRRKLAAMDNVLPFKVAS